MKNAWNGFVDGAWQNEINVRDFIQANYTPYYGDSSFLCGPTKDTLSLWAEISELKKQEIANGGVLDMDTDVVSTITSHDAGYINRKKEKIVDSKPISVNYLDINSFNEVDELPGIKLVKFNSNIENNDLYHKVLLQIAK